MLHANACLLFTCICTVALTACGSARRGEPFTGPLLMSNDALAGRQVFMANCHQCHPGGEAGLGPALNNKLLPKFLIRLQVRNGIGAMPAFSEQDITDDALDDLLIYLEWLHGTGKQDRQVRSIRRLMNISGGINLHEI
jgi:mono/diheme cytochrome c family protein